MVTAPDSPRRIALALAAAVLVAQPALAQWRVGQDTPEGSSTRIDVAVVENDSGHVLELYRDDRYTVRGAFVIRGGFDTMDPDSCPTYRVDERTPHRVTFDGGRCQILPKEARFTLGPAGEARNRELRRIMNGSQLVFRYRLGNGTYRETAFTLRGSKYALTTAIPSAEILYDE